MSITITDVTYSFKAKPVLSAINLTLNPGFNVLLGPNGAGKSTLLSLLTGQRTLQQGNITFADYDITQETRAIMGQLGVVFQQTTLDLDLTVLQNLTYFGALHGLSAALVLERITPVLTQLALIERLHDRVRSLNEGHRRRVEIARCMIHLPQYLLLDEATVGLDVDSRKLIIEHIRAIVASQKLTVLWTTHLMDEVLEQDPLFILNQGKLIEQGLCQSLLLKHQQSSVFDLYRALTQPQGLL
ncbi:MAG: ATP-binding cassette domain-containing protein [Glaciecola sp.]|nr:ATP-binding cassette domain-containing protein [Glaciecola sp.]MDG1814810.1 ATP-binding cassette domain-containing protein [Glaciecola sp.]MDG2098955.1 ATP-binding cassette domain-containing protein [Glaciecola sp.]